ncbi:MAG TPA: transcription termination/antitermination NusG family protein [Kiritimatiellia bacterium]|nr:transcription termination/antitermination NusG family protein [Kiritimatiellia bacterium]HRZ11463.1 transcription termination/antitermination NusG family protein [Kiritimatiellia bacterium]HSA16986.1 transcription termination/antitermination NusG family protein [Kiritimatiellia bacterium]
MNSTRQPPPPEIGEPGPGEAWVVLHTRPRCEKKLEAFCRRAGMPAYLPLHRKVHRYGARERSFWSPLFPGYVFCAATAAGRSTLRQNQHVANLLEVLDQARLVGQLEQIRQALAVDDVIEVMPYLAAGRRVQVTAGPFKGLEGVVQRVKGRTKVVLNVDMIEQSVCVEVDSTWLASA